MDNQDNKSFKEFNSFEQFFDQAEKRPGYWEELAKLEFTNEILDQMKQSEISRSELASRLDVTPGLVTRLLNGRNNFELATMVRIAMAVNCRFRSHLQPEGQSTMWLDVLNEEPKRENVIPWNPDDYKTVELFKVDCEESNYVPVAFNSR
jgi:transcriptional regulator with XRE-family HTH domain